ncbi:MAG: hypothetical protein DRQ65_08285 [Gammaproteobacteria bacterium]|nr:MAG: hypothetical protein DRQ65_08285 [Gammaproteobacteria bacterium]
MSVLPTVEEAKDMLARAMDPDAYPDDNEDSIYKHYGYITEDVFIAFVEQRLVSVDDYDYTLQVDEGGRFFVTQKDVEGTGPKNLLLVEPGTYRLVRIWNETNE